jgi:acyl-CoA dehydrogenase
MQGYLLTFLIILGVILFIPSVRRPFFTVPIFRVLRKLKLLPQISETERIALRAGNSWIEKDLFAGNPNFKKILNESYPSLSKTEKEFIEAEVNKVCEMTDDWQTFQENDLPKKVWDYLKKEKFFGMMIPKKYGGLEFSPLGQSTIVQKLATRSQTLAITVMVPNSLGPAELLLHYGTDKQKKHYLPRLAKGQDIPCFALTEPLAGTDASSIRSEGIVFKDKNGKLKIRLNFEKRYITLGGIASLIGLAFQLKDPKKLLGNKLEIGITCALIPSNTKGVFVERRHNPMGVPFINSPISGTNVEIDVDQVIGGQEGLGKGWKMLMESLAVGRGISLPAISAGGIQLVTRSTINYSQIRHQFDVPIGKFEGIQEVLAEIAGLSYLNEAMRVFTAGAVGNKHHSSVVNGIVKYHATEQFRTVINHGMDILGGAGICRGPNNLLASPYIGAPIGITVEGANIVTRSLIQFGQGLIRAHPYAYDEIIALENGDIKSFDAVLWKHISHFFFNKIKLFFLGITRGLFYLPYNKNWTGRWEQRLYWASTAFACFSDTALLIFGGNLKRKEMISGKFGDVLSYMYMATCILRRLKSENYDKKMKPYAEWGLLYCFEKIEYAFKEILINMFPQLWLRPIVKLSQIFISISPRFGCFSQDHLKRKMAQQLLQNRSIKENLSMQVYVPKTGKEIMGLYEKTVFKIAELDPLVQRLKEAVKAGILPRKPLDTLVQNAVKLKLLNKAEEKALTELFADMVAAVQVDHFPFKN